jgi:NapH/MauN family ferredoxin-type protein
MVKKIKKMQILRHIVQLVFFILLPGLYTLTFTELKTVYKMIISGDFHFIKALPALSEFIIVILFTVLMGRVFCGWFCAFGTYNDWIHLIAKNVFKVKFKVNEKVDAALKYVKYGILLMLLIVTCTLGSNILEGTSPWDAFAQITDFSNVISGLLIGLILLVLITIGAFFVERFFCRYLCPLGAVFSIISKIGILKIDKPTDKCGKCRACTNVCSMGIPLYKNESVKGGECIECLKCIEICPRKNTVVNIAGEDLNPALASSVAIATFAGVYGLTNLTGAVLTKAGITSASSITVSSGIANKASNYKDGTYTGSGTGFRGGTTTVSVTIQNGQITDIQTVSSQDTPRYYDRASGTVMNEIISSQSIQVDTVSGATFTSEGIISAVEDALNQATNGSSSTSTSDENNSSSSSSSNGSSDNSGNVASSSDNNVNSNEQSGNTNTTSGFDHKDGNFGGANQSGQASNSTSKGASSSSVGSNSASNSTKSNSSASSSTVSVKYKDGTYTGTGTGFRGGTTEMSVTIAGGKITKVETVSSQDTERFYSYAENSMTSEIVSAQSTSVDTVSGATYSSRGIIEAVKNALSKAK